jgi:hypothetical protein
MQTSKPIDTAPSYSSPRRSWLEATGQVLKLRLLMLSTLWVFIAWALGRLADALQLPPYTAELIAATGLILFLGFLLYPVAAIKCPNCKGKVLAYFMSHSPFHRWLADLQSATHCPKCGDDGYGFGTDGEKSARHVG